MQKWVWGFLLFTLLFYLGCGDSGSFSSGSLDTAFGDSGRVVTSVGSADDNAYALAIDSSGRMVVVGSSNNGSNLDMAVVRYLATGALDTSFDVDGKKTFNFGSSNDDVAFSVTIQPDEKILIAGKTGSSTSDYAITRLLSDGTSDTSFSADGKLTVDFHSLDDEIRSVLFHDGKTVMGGWSQVSSSVYRFSVARITTAGVLDTAFSTDGRHSFAIASSSDSRAYAMAQQGTNYILGGYSHDGTKRDFALARINSTGALDTSFGTSGATVTSLSTLDNVIYDLKIKSDNSLFVAGYSNADSKNIYAVRRFSSDGVLDTTFGGDAKISTLGDAWGYGLSELSSGKVFTGGYSTVGSQKDFTFIQLTSSGSVDTTFGSKGRVNIDFAAGDDFLYALKLQSDEKVVAVGSCTANSKLNFCATRYVP